MNEGVTATGKGGVLLLSSLCWDDEEAWSRMLSRFRKRDRLGKGRFDDIGDVEDEEAVD